MLKTRKGIIIYFVSATLFVFVFSGYFFIEDQPPSQYEKAIEQIEYQLGYTDIYVAKNTENTTVQTDVPADSKNAKTVYLTFDDGPSLRTAEILDILDEYGIKATFFVLCDDKNVSREILKRTYEEGHSIGVHSASHSYSEIYKSVDSYLKDFEECFNYITDITGETPTIFRFPGGSVNSYNKQICKNLVDEMTRRGFTYFDWNVSSEDAVKGYTEDSIYSNIMKGCENRDVSVVLMHDSLPKKDTVAALKRVIPDLLQQGYTFDKLDEGAQPTVFKIE